MGQGALELALDEGEGIVNEGLADAVALGGDPVQGDLALGVGGLGEGDELGLAAIAAGVPGAVQGHHLVREAGRWLPLLRPFPPDRPPARRSGRPDENRTVGAGRVQSPVL